MSEDDGFDDVDESFCALANRRSSFSSLAFNSAFSARSIPEVPFLYSDDFAIEERPKMA
jgi:hypothetical protein